LDYSTHRTAIRKRKSEIVIRDSGEGMDTDAIQRCYLVVGRNRRQEQGSENRGRKIMGRKGIGKLAGFGLAEHVRVITWQKDKPVIQFDMSLNQLNKTKAGEAERITFPWTIIHKEKDWTESGTIITLSKLRHSTPIDVAVLTETLARRFSRTVLGEMEILVNNSRLPESQLEAIYSFPEDGGFQTDTLPGGQSVKYRYKYSQKPIHSKEMQGFTIQTNERTAEAPPFFFREW